MVFKIFLKVCHRKQERAASKTENLCKIYRRKSGPNQCAWISGAIQAFFGKSSQKDEIVIDRIEGDCYNIGEGREQTNKSLRQIKQCEEKEHE